MRKVIVVFIMILLIGTAIPVYGMLNRENSECRIKSPSSPGDYLRFMFFDTHIRSYRIHIPSSYDGTDSMPLVFVLHGYPGNSQNIMLCTEFNEKADEEGFIVVYPNGGDLSNFLYYYINYGIWGFYWNSWDSYDSDDVGFIRELINKCQSEFSIDENRIYVTGWSNGGWMAYRLGAELSDIIAAIGPVGGSIGGVWDYWERPRGDFPLYIIPEPENPLSVIVFHGMRDSSVPYKGLVDPLTREILLYSVNESVTFWVEQNNCNPIPEIDVSESGNIITRTYSDGDRASEVVLYAVVDGGHVWFGGPEAFFPPCEISATELIWDFFETHPKQ